MNTTSVAMSSDAGAELAAELAREMRRRWQAGQRAVTEEFLDEHPQLYHQPEAAIELIYEEYCLHQSNRDPDRNSDIEESILRRFPRWADPLRLMFDCHRRLLDAPQLRDRASHFPQVDERVDGFRIVAEIARGAHGRVYLAAQTALADRPVVLKVTPLRGHAAGGGAREHQSLARLQHTHIVPLHSVVADPARGVRILCMPYFGRSTLASLIESLAGTPHADRTGTHILQVIDAVNAAADPVPAAEQSAAPVRQMLASVNFAQAVCWIGACLADALHFAHERGVVHLDLKPSNVLLACDGQPLLLDFHLAREPISSGGPRPEHLGGTPAYMAPEHHAAMAAMQSGLPVPQAIDRRADVYALGAILCELLGGSPTALTGPSAPPPLTRLNPQVSRGLAAIIARCTAQRAAERYPTAAALADDLRRHLTDQPLAGVREGPAERWRKWRRRHPRAFRGPTMVVVIALAAALLFAAVQRLRQQAAAAARVELAGQVHRASEELRALYCADTVPPPQERLGALARLGESLWDRRRAVLEALPQSQTLDVRCDLQDIAICTASLELRAAAEGPSQRDHALRLLDEAEAFFGRSAVIEQERQALDDAPAVRGSGDSPPPPPPHTAWEHTAIGRALLRRGQLPAAAAELQAAIALDPAGRWCNFYYGVCAYRMARFDDAVAAFSVAIGADPSQAEFFQDRALAYRALGRDEDAERDLARAAAIGRGGRSNPHQ